MPKRSSRGGTFAALSQAASNVIVPAVLFFGNEYQKSRMSRMSRKPRLSRRTRRTRRSIF